MGRPKRPSILTLIFERASYDVVFVDEAYEAECPSCFGTLGLDPEHMVFHTDETFSTKPGHPASCHTCELRLRVEHGQATEYIGPVEDEDPDGDEPWSATAAA